MTPPTIGQRVILWAAWRLDTTNRGPNTRAPVWRKEEYRGTVADLDERNVTLETVEGVRVLVGVNTISSWRPLPDG